MSSLLTSSRERLRTLGCSAPGRRRSRGSTTGALSSTESSTGWHSSGALYLTPLCPTSCHILNNVSLVWGVLSWRASGDRQISLSVSDERAFANFRVKNVVFTGTHFCAVLSMVGERAFANFYSKTLFFTSTHFCAFTGGRLCQLVELGSAGSNRVNRRR